MKLLLADNLQAKKKVYTQCAVDLPYSTIYIIIETYQTPTTGTKSSCSGRPEILFNTDK